MKRKAQTRTQWSKQELFVAILVSCLFTNLSHSLFSADALLVAELTSVSRCTPCDGRPVNIEAAITQRRGDIRRIRNRLRGQGLIEAGIYAAKKGDRARYERWAEIGA